MIARHTLKIAQSLAMKPTVDRPGSEASNETFTKAQELRSFLFLAVVMAPILAGMIVGGYGFIVWMFQAVVGPPGS